MGEKMIFKPELTYGYQTEIGTKPPSNLKLFILFEEQLKEEDKVLDNSRETENQVSIEHVLSLYLVRIYACVYLVN